MNKDILILRSQLRNLSIILQRNKNFSSYQEFNDHLQLFSFSLNRLLDFFNKEEKTKSLFKISLRKRNNSDHPLRRIRIKKGLTLKALSMLANVNYSYLSRIENGKRRMNESLIRSLAKALQCHPADLISLD